MTRSLVALIPSVLVALPSVAQAPVSTADSTARRGCADVISVNLKERTVGGIPLDTTIAAVVVALGQRRVRQTTRRAEGHSEEAYDIDYCGHSVQRTWSGILIRDPAFRTQEGVGVGSPIGALTPAYGAPQISMEEGVSLRYSVRDANLNLIVQVADACYRWEQGPPTRPVSVDPQCPVLVVWFPLRRSLDRQ